MDKQRKITNEHEARRLLAAARVAGADLGQWGRANGIDGRSLNAWRLNLARRGTRSALRRPRSSTHAAASTARHPGPALVELVPTPRPASSTSRYAVHVGDARVEFGDDFDPRTLRRGARGPARMLSLPPTVRVFIAVAPIDMHGSFDALSGAVRRLGLDPVDGHLYLFLNKRRRHAKALWFDSSGWCVLAKRLEAGSFQLPPIVGDTAQVQIDGTTFASLLAGIDFTAARRGWYRRSASTDARPGIDTTSRV